MSSATYPHIEVTSEGVAYVAGTRTKVLEVALDRIAHHWDADEIHRQHPHLSVGKIYAALAFYEERMGMFDNVAILDEPLACPAGHPLGSRRKALATPR